jgi:hypothetical protein
MRDKRDEDEDEREQPWTPQELADLEALWDSPEVQRTMANLARYGSPFAPGEDKGDDEGEG